MTFSVVRKGPFRSLGLYRRSSGKHAAPRGSSQPAQRTAGGPAHRAAHAASMPRLTGPNAGDNKAA